MASIIDPYVTGAEGNDATDWTDLPPPAAAQAPGDANVVQLYVPSENTELDFGAGAIPGIRMATNPHVHLTERNTPTTISLGKPNGMGIESSWPSGLNVYTAGAKRETVVQSVEEAYKDTYKQTVTHDTTLDLLANKSETVGGDTTIVLKQKKSETVTGDVTQTLEGNVTVHIVKNKKETVDGDISWLHQGKFFNLTYGFAHDVFLGERLSSVIGANTAINVGGLFNVSLAYQRAYIGGNKFEIVSRTGLAVNNSAKITKDNIKIDSAKMAYKSATQELNKADLAVMIEANAISSSTMRIFK